LSVDYFDGGVGERDGFVLIRGALEEPPPAPSSGLPREGERGAVQLPRMKRFRRWVFNGLAAMSLLLSIATLALWLRSYLGAFSISQCEYLPGMQGSPAIPRPLATQRFSDLEFNRGKVAILDQHRSVSTTIPSWGWQIFTPNTPITIRTNILGFEWHHEKSPGWLFVRLIIPIWFIAGVFAIFPAVWVFSRRRPIAGFCPVCGYDLRATPDRCPECGKAVERAI
jgi:hypothetical protein